MTSEQVEQAHKLLESLARVKKKIQEYEVSLSFLRSDFKVVRDELDALGVTLTEEEVTE